MPVRVSSCYHRAVAGNDNKDREQRAAKRSDWPIAKYNLGEEPGGNLSATTTAEERLAMMWPLALEAWKLAGIPIPDFRWEDAPSRLIRNYIVDGDS